jgi:beta-lysine N6-acetyltransferase
MKNSCFNIKSDISHNQENNRVYLKEMNPFDFPDIISYMDELANENGYTKLFAKLPSKYVPAFINAGYMIEASIPCFYNGKTDAVFLVKYLSEKRKKPETSALKAFQEMLLKPQVNIPFQMLSGYDILPLKEFDAELMVILFKQVFESYPFPIFNPEFIRKSMKEDGTRYFGAFYDGKLVAVSSSECDHIHKNAEMTDFAVVPEHRRRHLATHLLSYMENELCNEGFKTFYTIARLHSLSMNKTFYNMEYKYAGTLTNNTQICGQIESMNVWYKKASK